MFSGLFGPSGQPLKQDPADEAARVAQGFAVGQPQKISRAAWAEMQRTASALLASEVSLDDQTRANLLRMANGHLPEGISLKD